MSELFNNPASMITMFCDDNWFEANVRKTSTGTEVTQTLSLQIGLNHLTLQEITDEQLQAIHSAISAHFYKQQMHVEAKEDAPECPASMLTS